MNRIIKFKVVWNNQVSLDAYTIGEFIDGVELDFPDGGTLPMDDIDWGADKVDYIEYTGLLDRNGVEIYEGDILVVRNLHDGDEYVWNNEKQEAIPFLIDWDDKHKGFNLPANVRYEPYNYEVIGNIYSNPELLKS